MLHATLAVNAQKTSNLWIRSLDQLEAVLADDYYGNPREWTKALGDALVYLDLAMRQHRAMGKASDGLFAEVDEMRPTLARHADALRSQHDQFLEQIRSLREDVAIASRALWPSDGYSNMSAAIGRATCIRLHRRASQLLADMLHNNEAERALIMESINTDIGAGD